MSKTQKKNEVPLITGKKVSFRVIYPEGHAEAQEVEDLMNAGWQAIPRIVEPLVVLAKEE